MVFLADLTYVMTANLVSETNIRYNKIVCYLDKGKHTLGLSLDLSIKRHSTRSTIAFFLTSFTITVSMGMPSSGLRVI